ncbi:MAG: hypothetical protein K0U52_08205 [Gammaproteobacteria bacterium]|nr:hypothetical protein [Gammaproteobacteria bacterium]
MSILLFLDTDSLVHCTALQPILREKSEPIWFQVAVCKWGPEFWQWGMTRDVRASKPLCTWSREVGRLALFEQRSFKVEDYRNVLDAIDKRVVASQEWDEVLIEYWQRNLETLKSWVPLR